MSGATLPKIGLAAMSAAACCAPGASAQKSAQPIRVGYRPQVFIVARDGGARRLTAPPGQHAIGAWARRRSRVAVAAPGRVEIRALNGEVTHTIRDTGGVAAWAPHDRRLLLATLHQYKKPGRYTGTLEVAGLDGRHRRVVARRATGAADWAPDGRTIYYARGIVSTFSGQETLTLWAVGPRGRGRHRVASGVAPGSRVTVSPDGRLVLFECAEPERSALCVVRPDGGGRRKLIRANFFYEYGFVYGGREVFGNKRHGHPQLASIAGRHRVLGARFLGAQYAVSPDGEHVAWVSRRHGRTLILSASADGGYVRVLARFTSQGGLTEVADLAWSPDSRRLALVPYRHDGD